MTSVDVGKIARAMYHPPDFEKVGMHDVQDYIISEDAEADTLAELRTQPPRVRKCQESAAMGSVSV